jgi:hypothetical protein
MEDEMKKAIVGLLVMLVGMALALGLHAGRNEDYKVIKNALHGVADGGGGRQPLRWLKIEMMGKEGAGERVKLTLPVSLMEIIIRACPEKKFSIDRGCEIDIQRVWNDLKAAGPLALVEVEDSGETVKIWLE